MSAFPLRPAGPADVVHKDECCYCFQAATSKGGILVCLSCFVSACGSEVHNHAAVHKEKTGHVLYLHIQKTKLEKGEENVTKLAIGVAGGASAGGDEFETETRIVHLEDDTFSTESSPQAGEIEAVAASVIAAESAEVVKDVESWEAVLTDCAHVRELAQVEGAPQLEAKALSHCASCELSSNLWLCMTCGALGCGRKNWDGSGGNNHAVDHAHATGHHVVCKLGTITPDGNADIHCYACDEERKDPLLAQHLAHFGIDVSQQEKTERSLAELELEQNLSFDFSAPAEEGKKLEPIFGKGYTGMKNLGNTCYIASTLQVLFAVPEIAQRYTKGWQDHIMSCSSQDPSLCLECQMYKVGDGLLSGRYSSEGRTADITPRMIKFLVGREHPAFRTMGQQDAQEFLQFLLDALHRDARRIKSEDATQLFDHIAETKISCAQCRAVRCARAHANQVTAHVRSVADGQEAPSLEDTVCSASGLEEVDLACPVCGAQSAHKRTGFVTFPKYLLVQAMRFEYENWVPKKVMTSLRIPDQLDLHAMRAQGIVEGDIEVKDTPAAPAQPPVDESKVEMITAMGFPAVRAKKALRETNGDVEAAINWIMAHMDDPDIDMEDSAPQTQSGAGSPSEESVSMLMGMGFPREQAGLALRECGNSVERAVEWLFSHVNELDALVAAANSQERQGSAAPAIDAVPIDTGAATYVPRACIVHLGKSPQSGHYVAYIQREGRWVLFNDEKVALSSSPQTGLGYVYVLERTQ